jgi:nucleoid-associated protein YgaU
VKVRLLRWFSSVVLLTVALTTLGLLGARGLAPPPPSPYGVVHWASTREPIVVVFALIRMGAFAVGGYLLLVVVVSGAVGALDERRGTLTLDRLTFGLARGLLGIMRLVGLSVPMATVAHAQQAPPPSSTASIHEVEARDASTASEAVIRPVADEPTPPEALPPDTGEQYVVAAGDSFWGVAAAHLSDVTGRVDLSDSEIATYWRAVVEANPLPNPDLLFVDQVIALPAVTP